MPRRFRFAPRYGWICSDRTPGNPPGSGRNRGGSAHAEDMEEIETPTGSPDSPGCDILGKALRSTGQIGELLGRIRISWRGG